MMISDRELEKLLREWGANERARLDISAKASEAKNRAYIMQRIQEMSAQQQPAASPLSIFSLLHNIISATRLPVGVIASFVLVFGLSGSVVYSSQKSLPGSNLYPFKLQLEQAQIQMSSAGPARLEKKIAFSEKRLQEFLSLEKQGALSEIKKQTVRGAILSYQNNITELSKELSSLQKGQEDPKSLMAAAVRLDDTTARGLKNLQASQNQELKSEIKQARQAAQQAGRQAVDVISKTYDRAGLTANDVRSRIEQKISSTREEVKSAISEHDSNRPTNAVFSDIQQQLAAAEQHLAKSDFGNAMDKWNISQILVEEIGSDNSQGQEAPLSAEPAPVSGSVLPVVISNSAAAVKKAPVVKETIKQETQGIEIWFSPSKDAYYFNE